MRVRAVERRPTSVAPHVDPPEALRPLLTKGCEHRSLALVEEGYDRTAAHRHHPSSVWQASAVQEQMPALDTSHVGFLGCDGNSRPYGVLCGASVLTAPPSLSLTSGPMPGQGFLREASVRGLNTVAGPTVPRPHRR